MSALEASMDEKSPRRVFVLGAGFTRAFLPNAPLMSADYDGDGCLEKKFADIPHARRLLQLEKKRAGGTGSINIERLMSRLDAGMPYDSNFGTRSELDLLLYEVKQAFLTRLRKAGGIDEARQRLLFRFAAYCIKNNFTCITFNYDDLLDWALTRASTLGSSMQQFHWNPRYGYGFDCRPSNAGFSGHVEYRDGDHGTLLLKLHGSINWRVRFGFSPPYAPGVIEYRTDWGGQPVWNADAPKAAAERDEPFLIPPVMSKSAVISEPIFRVIWNKAYRALSAADEVIFIGYSMPPTDLGARFLFAEATRLDASITVVLKPTNDARGIRDAWRAYEDLFWLKEDRLMDMDGADWLTQELKGWLDEPP